MPGISKTFCTSVDFPEPDGPDMMITSGVIVLALSFDILNLLAQFFDVRFNLQCQAGNGQRFGIHARRF